MTEEEKRSRKKFFRETGKTPEQEAHDAARTLGALVSICVAVAVLAGIYAVKSFLGY